VLVQHDPARREFTRVWFDQEVQGDDLQGAAWAFGDGLWNSSTEVDRRSQHLKYASQYLGRNVLSLTDFEAVPNAVPQPSPTFSSPRNATRTLVDTAMSQFAKTETRTMFLTDGGTTDQATRAQTCTDASNALIVQTGTERELRKAALHAAVFDLGSVKFVKGENGPIAEHVPAWENMFDPVDGRRGRYIRVQHFVADKDRLIHEYARPKYEKDDTEAERIRKKWDADDLEDKIRQSSASGLSTSDHTTSDQHCIGYELWRLPVGSEPGRHVIVTDQALLLDEVWTDTDFGFVDFGWSDDPLGLYPVSIAAINSSSQDELDGVGRRISQILRLCAVPRYIVSGAPSQNPPQANGQAQGTTAVQIRGGSDAVGDIIQPGPGQTVQAVSAGDPVGPALFNHEDRIWARCFAQTGINEASSQGTRPAGLNSAPAQREWNEIRQDRLSLVALQFQQAHVDAATILLKLVADMDDYEISVKDTNGRWLRKVKVADLNLGASDYVIQGYPISALPSTPTGKLAAAADLLQMQAIDRSDFMELVQLPDLKRALDIKLASRRAVEKIISRMLDTEAYEPPSERMDLTYALEYSTTQWLNGIAEEMSDPKLKLLNDWINEVVKIQQKAAAKATAAASLKGTSIAPLPAQPLAPAASTEDFGATMAGAA
jgi:hypothetical protein